MGIGNWYSGEFYVKCMWRKVSTMQFVIIGKLLLLMNGNMILNYSQLMITLWYFVHTWNINIQTVNIHINIHIDNLLILCLYVVWKYAFSIKDRKYRDTRKFQSLKVTRIDIRLKETRRNNYSEKHDFWSAMEY